MALASPIGLPELGPFHRQLRVSSKHNIAWNSKHLVRSLLHRLVVEQHVPNPRSAILGGSHPSSIKVELLASRVCSQKSGETVWTDGFVLEELDQRVWVGSCVGKQAIWGGFGAVFSSNKDSDPGPQRASDYCVSSGKLDQVGHANTVLFLPGPHPADDVLESVVLCSVDLACAECNRAVGTAKVVSRRPTASVMEAETDGCSCTIIAAAGNTRERKSEL